MHGVILAAGEGSRMGVHTADRPKAFMNLGGRTLYARQRSLLERHVEELTVVLGYAADNVREETGPANVVEVPDWDEYDNAESLRRALVEIDDDVLVMNGDVVVTEDVLERLVERHGCEPPGRSVVACTRGHQTDSTAIRTDEDRRVTDYGMIRGHRHAGMGVVDGEVVEAAAEYLADNREEWYPVVYPAFETTAVMVPAGHHVEINRPSDRLRARRKLPVVATGEADAET